MANRTSHSHLFRDGTISNSRANCSSALRIISVADGLISMNQEKLVDRQFRTMAANSFSKQSPPPIPPQSRVFFNELGCNFAEDAASIAASCLGMHVCFPGVGPVWSCRPSYPTYFTECSNFSKKADSILRASALALKMQNLAAPTIRTLKVVFPAANYIAAAFTSFTQAFCCA